MEDTRFIEIREDMLCWCLTIEVKSKPSLLSKFN